jgi:hypothetical protein
LIELFAEKRASIWFEDIENGNHNTRKEIDIREFNTDVKKLPEEE